MALDAGELTLTLEFAQGLKDKDLFGRQDPYCVITCGSQRFKSRTHTGNRTRLTCTRSLQVDLYKAIFMHVHRSGLGTPDHL